MAGFIVAIDGRAGSGKSTTAKGIAKRLNFFYLDTGAMYRAFTLKYLRLVWYKRYPGLKKTDADYDSFVRKNQKFILDDIHSLSKIDSKLIRKLLKDTKVDLIYNNGNLRVWLDGVDVTETIRNPVVNCLVSQVSAIKSVRYWMARRQREIARNKNVVCEGRDMTTFVFPEAQVKIFMDAELRVRAQRRRKELKAKGVSVKLKDIIENLKFRDKYDSTRRYAPLKIAPDAIFIDTTKLTIKQEIAIVEKIVRQTLAKLNIGKNS